MTKQRCPPTCDEINATVTSTDLDFDSSALSFSRLLDGDLGDTELNEISGLFEADDSAHPGSHPEAQMAAAAAAAMDEGLLRGGGQREDSVNMSPTSVSALVNTSETGKRELQIDHRNKWDNTAAAPSSSHLQQEVRQNQDRASRRLGNAASISLPSYSSLQSISSEVPILPRRVSLPDQEKPIQTSPYPTLEPTTDGSQKFVSKRCSVSENSVKIKNAISSKPKRKSSHVAPAANKKFKDGVDLTPEAEAMVEAACVKMEIDIPERTVATSKQSVAKGSKAAEELHRNRNRVHARNTRLRKKAYIDALKQTVNDLTEQRDAAKEAGDLSRQSEMENRLVRFQVMQAFLDLRGKEVNRNIDEYPRWAAILEEDFVFTMPGNRSENVQSGISAVMEGSRDELAILGAENTNISSIEIEYQCDEGTLLMENTRCILEWRATTRGAASALELREEITIQGCLKAQFNSMNNKIRSADLLYDTDALYRVLGKVS